MNQVGFQVKNYINNQYYALFLFGSTFQPISLLLDSGSSLTWVPSQNCPSIQCPLKKFKTESKQFFNYTIPESISYGNGKITGHLVSDTIYAYQSLPGTPEAQVNFVAADRVENLGMLESEGLLGLSPRIYKVGDDQK